MAGSDDLVLFTRKNYHWNAKTDLLAEIYMEGTVLLSYFIFKDVTEGLFDVFHRKIHK